MKKLRKMLILILTLSMMIAGTAVSVSADTTTDLKSMKVYAVDAAGKKTEIPINFNSTTYTYDLTVLSTTVSISIEATAADSTSKWAVEKDGINTKMDFGTNLTNVAVTSAAGAVQKYTLNTKKLTAQEEATYKAPEASTDDDDSKTTKKDSDKTVKVGKKEMKITSSFKKSVIPEGFKKEKAEYDGTKYTCIKGETKDLTAFYLYNDDTEGFHIYNSDTNEFYKMNNIQIKSRMYTIVNPEKTDGLLKNYDKKTVTMIDQEVSAWVLDEEEGMYLVYAMNWNGDTSLYCYDDNEKCFQRYLVSSDANSQVEAANTAYDNLQKKYNSLVDRYNILLKILCLIVIILIILIFVIINMSLNKKEKNVKNKNSKKDKEDKKNKKDKKESEDEPDALEDSFDDEFEIESQLKATDDMVEELGSETQMDEEAEEEPESAPEPEQPVKPQPVSEPEQPVESEPDFEEVEEEIPKRKFFGRKRVADRTYGEEPTFGTEGQSNKGFYGGEIDDEDEVLIDITDDEPEEKIKAEPDMKKSGEAEAKETKPVTNEEIERNTAAAQQEAEEDLKETLKSMLPDEQDNEEDEDLEFIDLN